MILGTGSDLVDIRRVERALARHGERFAARCFTDAERATAKGRARAGAKVVAGTYAKRFAAKEACAKALGSGLAIFGAKGGVFWREIGVVNRPGGKPECVLSPRIEGYLARMLPPGHEARVHLTLTDEYPYALAQVVIEALPRSSGAAG